MGAFKNLDIERQELLGRIIEKLMNNYSGGTWDECESVEEVEEGIRDALKNHVGDPETLEFYNKLLVDCRIDVVMTNEIWSKKLKDLNELIEIKTKEFEEVTIEEEEEEYLSYLDYLDSRKAIIYNYNYDKNGVIILERGFFNVPHNEGGAKNV